MAKGIRWSGIVKKAHSDPEFKKQLLENPRETIEKLSGIKLPEGVDYIVHEQTPKTVHLVVPLTASLAAKPDAFFLEDDDASKSQPDAFFLEDDDASKSKPDAFFLEDDDADTSKPDAFFLEDDDTSSD